MGLGDSEDVGVELRARPVDTDVVSGLGGLAVVIVAGAEGDGAED